MRSKPFVSANFDNYSLPGDGDFDNLFLKCQNPHPSPDPPPPPSGLTLIGALLVDWCKWESSQEYRAEPGTRDVRGLSWVRALLFREEGAIFDSFSLSL